MIRSRALLCFILWISLPVAVLAQQDPLPSWNEGTVKKTILTFVVAVSQEGNALYVPPEDRIATFDNDGTLWAEQPLIQLLFLRHRVLEMVKEKPSLRQKQPFKAVMEKDHAYFKKMTPKEIVGLLLITHTGLTEAAFHESAVRFFETTKYPGLNLPLAQVVYQPQLELLEYLRNNGFKVFICSGGTVELMRVISMKYYGVPPEQVIGSEFEYRYRDSAGVNDLVRLPHLRAMNDKKEKPVNIQYHIGKRPILACGNEGGGGDIYMLRFSQGNKYPSLQLIVNHDDAGREFNYQEKDSISLTWAARYKWNVISMKNDWNKVFAK